MVTQGNAGALAGESRAHARRGREGYGGDEEGDRGREEDNLSRANALAIPFSGGCCLANGLCRAAVHDDVEGAFPP